MSKCKVTSSTGDILSFGDKSLIKVKERGEISPTTVQFQSQINITKYCFCAKT